MSDDPVVRRAEVLFHFGRSKQAIRELRLAITSDPKNEQLRDALAQITAAQARSTGGLKHSVVAWVLYVGSIASAMLPLLLAVRLIPRDSRVPESDLLVAAYAAVFLAVAILLLLVGRRAFFWLWFSYLRSLPKDELLHAEAALRRSLNVEPEYSRMRTRALEHPRDA